MSSIDRLVDSVEQAVSLANKATMNKCICSALAKVLQQSLSTLLANGVESLSSSLPTQPKARGSVRIGQSPPAIRQFCKMVFNAKNWIEAHSKNQQRMLRRTLINLFGLIHSAVATLPESAKFRVDFDDLEEQWEKDVVQFLDRQNSLCLLIWIDDETDVLNDKDTLQNLDTDNVAVFRFSTSNYETKLANLSHLDDHKYDARVRIVINCKSPATVLTQLNAKKFAFLRSVPIMVNTGGIVENFEAAIQELTKIRPGVLTSAKQEDIETFCAMATLLWIDNGRDEERVMVEKRAHKGGVVLIKTESTETGLRWLETHGSFGKINPFRIIIGDNTLPANTGKSKSKSKDKDKENQDSKPPTSPRVVTDDSVSTFELVEILRNRLKWMTPILVYYAHQWATDENLYNFKSIRLTSDLNEAINFASMKPLPWAPDIAYFSHTDAAAKDKVGILRIISIKCRNLAPKDSNGSSDPYYVIMLGEEKIKGHKILGTIHPEWLELNYEIPCKLTDKITIELWDWDRIGSHDEEGHIECEVKDLVPAPIDVLEVTQKLKPRKSKRISGTITLELGYRYQVDASSTPKGKHFGRSLVESLQQCEDDMIPHLIDKACAHIRAKALKSEGIFRLPGNANRIAELKKLIDDGADVDLDEDDVYDVSSLLKLYFRELPDPLLPSAFFDDFRKASNVDDKRGRIKYLTELFGKIPEINRNVLIEMVLLCHEIAQYEEINKMPARNLATCLAPTLIIPANFSAAPAQILTDTKIITDLFEFVIVNHQKIFRDFMESVEANAKAKQVKATERAKEREKEREKEKGKLLLQVPQPAESDSLTSPRSARSPRSPRSPRKGDKGDSKRRKLRREMASGSTSKDKDKRRRKKSQPEAQQDTNAGEETKATTDEDDELRRIEEELRRLEEEEKELEEEERLLEEKLNEGNDANDDE